MLNQNLVFGALSPITRIRSRNHGIEIKVAVFNINPVSPLAKCFLLIPLNFRLYLLAFNYNRRKASTRGYNSIGN